MQRGRVDRYSFQLHASSIIKDILLEIGFIEGMRIILGNREVPKLFPQFPLFAKIRFNPFDSESLATLHFAIL